jgi:hypothetical protein
MAIIIPAVIIITVDLPMKNPKFDSPSPTIQCKAVVSAADANTDSTANMRTNTDNTANMPNTAIIIPTVIITSVDLAIIIPERSSSPRLVCATYNRRGCEVCMASHLP